MCVCVCVCVFAVQEQRGIVLVLLCSNSSESDSSSSSSSTGLGESPTFEAFSALQHSTQEVDKLAVLANHQALMGVATDISQRAHAHHSHTQQTNKINTKQEVSNPIAPPVLGLGLICISFFPRLSLLCVFWLLASSFSSPLSLPFPSLPFPCTVGAQNDTANSVILRSRRTTLILLRVERASLIVVFKNSVDATVCLQHIERTADLVRKVLLMASNLKM